MNRIAIEVRRRRVAAGTSQVELGIAIGRSQWWVSSVEKGTVRIDKEVARRMFAAIDKLQALKRERQPKYSRLFQDVRLPSRIEMANRVTTA